MIVLSDWFFHMGWKEMFPGIDFTSTFSDLSSLLDTQFVYQESVKLENQSAFTITILVFRHPNILWHERGEK